MKFQRRVLIVDDEEPARKTLRRLLASHPEISVVAEAESVTEAIKLFHETKPDLIFLDVQIPKRDGFSLLPELQPPPEIIFVTAYDTFAVKAFEVNAMDFLVKPVHPDRLALALARVCDHSPRPFGPLTEHDPVFLRSDRELRVVQAGKITHIEIDQNYSTVHIARQKHMWIRRSLTEWTKQLPPEIFQKLDRSTIINFPAIRDVVRLPLHREKVRFQESDQSLQLGLIASRRLRKLMRERCLFPTFAHPKM